ncbi:MAG: LysM peptidoglycan-binding domain-containing protein, partial [Chloroflexota bacterium]
MKKFFPFFAPFLLFLISLACSRETNFANVTPVGTQFATPTFIYDDPSLTARAPTPRFTLTPLPPLAPGETLIYRVQTDDTLQRIAQRFNVPLNDILALNKMNADEPLALDQILLVPARIGQTGPSFKIVPDSELVYSLGVAGFNPTEFIAKRGGYLAKYKEFAEGAMRNGGEIIQAVALNHSISPRILLAVLEYQTGWVTNPATPEDLKYPLGIRDPLKQGLYKQLDAFADQLNLGYYSWRYGSITVIDLVDGTQQRIHPTLNAGTVSLHYALSRRYKLDEWNKAMGQGGVYATFNKLFGNPFERAIEPLVPEGLTQPDLALPFVKDIEWLFISGPHAAWLPGSPWAA